MYFEFPPYRLDLNSGELFSGDRPIRLRRKTWDVLRCLVMSRGALVTKDQLQRSVWGGEVVSDDVITGAVGELRRALSPPDGSACLIETVRGRGFRFLAAVRTQMADLHDTNGGVGAGPSVVGHERIGREVPLQQLYDAWASARSGKRQVVFVAGERGIGKSTLVRMFLETIGADNALGVLTGHGRCPDVVGPPTPFFPWLEGLEQLCAGEQGQRVVAGLREHAPSWLAQLNIPMKHSERQALSREGANAALPARFNALLGALEELARHEPLLLVIEDLHHADPASVELLRYWARRFNPAPVMILGTVRTHALESMRDPTFRSWRDLVLRRNAQEIELQRLSAAEVHQALSTRFPGVDTSALSALLLTHSGGNPLHMEVLLDELRRRKFLSENSDSWSFREDSERAGLSASYAAVLRLASYGASQVIGGRDEIFAKLESHWRRCLRGERGTILVTGEAGIGKTALCQHFIQTRLRDDGPYSVRILNGQCSEVGGQHDAYAPIVRVLNEWRAQDHAGDFDELLGRTAPRWLRLLRQTHLPAVSRSPFTATEARPEAFVREAVNLLEEASATQPLLVVLEDIQWADLATLSLLTQLSSRKNAARVLILATARSEREFDGNESRGSLLADLATIVHRIPLPPLPASAVEECLRSVMPNPEMARQVAPEVERRSGGNPLFAQAIGRAILEAYANEDDARDTMIATPGLLNRVGIPVELESLVQQQLRKISGNRRRLIESAAIVGEEFDAATVAAAMARSLAPVEADLIAETHESYLIAPDGRAAWPDGTISGRYRFRHGIYHEAILAEIPTERAARLHRRVGERLEQAFSVPLGGVVVRLGEHFESGRDFSRAANYLEHCGMLMISRSANRQAINYFERALQALARLPQGVDRWKRELRVYVGHGLTTGVIDGPQAPAVRRAYEEVHRLRKHLDDVETLLPTWRGLWLFDLLTWNYQGMHEVACEMLDRCRADGSPAPVALACCLMGATLLYRGDVCAARALLEEGLNEAVNEAELPKPSDWFFDPRVEMRGYLAWASWLAGAGDRSRALLNEMSEIAESSGHLNSRALALWFQAAMAQLRRDPSGFGYTDAMENLVEDVDGSLWAQLAEVTRMVANFERNDAGDLTQALHLLASESNSPSTMIARAYLLGQVAAALGKSGSPTNGIVVLDIALARISENGARVSEADLLRIRGDLFLQAGDRSAAQESYCRAIDTAKQQGSTMFALRAATAHAAMMGEDPRLGGAARRELRSVLASIHEGFDQFDLELARTVLNRHTPARNVPSDDTRVKIRTKRKPKQ